MQALFCEGLGRIKTAVVLPIVMGKAPGGAVADWMTGSRTKKVITEAIEELGAI